MKTYNFRKMKKIIVLISFFSLIICAAPGRVNAQIIDGAYKRSDVADRKPMVLPTPREADIFWSKMIWRIIDLREKMNEPLYYPTTPINDRISLINLLLQGIESGQITAYDARNDDEFKTPLTYQEVKDQFGAQTTTERVMDFNTGEYVNREVKGEIHPNEVKEIMVKEEWYFDKQTSSLNVRIIGLCPIREYTRADDPTGQVVRTQLFWVYYPEVRKLLATHDVFNPDNNAQSMTFDDLFIKRYFSSYIIEESNTFNNRAITQYLSGKDAMYESQRIENEIFNFEQDLWEY